MVATTHASGILPVENIPEAQLVGAVLATGRDPELLARNTSVWKLING
ncbi:hypothetical protein IU501_31545 [Nocardia otitidiscaviarum]|nr:hypothetical protein [Nocardia otitidiscaviarum]MBF6137512.1 hypothetical protein [Nocardia otitidiscaviarum]MBF6488226.1 hypothetical protein [Nocardia otitidiscaviarum]